MGKAGIFLRDASLIDRGVAHLIVILEPLTVTTIEQFGRIAELVRAL